MAWSCGGCGIELSDDDVACTQCAAPKTSWTIVQNETRTFRLSGKRVSYLVGRGADLVDAQRAPALKKSVALALAEERRAPASKDVLTARLHPKGQTDWTIDVTVEFEAAEAAELSFPLDAPAGFPKDGQHDVRFCFVHGPEDVAGLELPGVDHLVDVTEEGGHAPWVELAALGKPRRRLPLGAGSRYLINARFFDRTGRVPVRGAACTVGGRAGTTDDEGHLRLDDFGPGRHVAELAGGTIDVPASHDPGYVISVRLPFLEAAEAELAARPWSLRAFDEEPEDTPPGWLPADERWVDEDPDPEDHDPSEKFTKQHGDPDGGDAVAYLINARIFDKTGRVPVRDTECTIDGAAARTDAEGHLLLEDVGPGRHDVEIAGGTIDVPASHDPAYVISVRLPFLEAAEEERAARPWSVRTFDEEPEDAPPEWLPADERWVDDEPDEDGPDPSEKFTKQHGDVDEGDEAAEFLINARIFDKTGRVPLRDTECTIDGVKARTDADGLLRLEGVGPGRHDLEIAGGTIDVPASHHVDCVVGVRLPFLEASGDGLPRPRRSFDERDEADDGPPTWSPLDPAAERVAVETDDDGPLPTESYAQYHANADPVDDDADDEPE